MRRLSALVTTAAVLAALTACSGSGASTCDSGVTSGEASGIVDVDGKLGSAPDVTFAKPLITKSIERSVIEAGNGDTVENGQPVILEATILSGRDGSVLQQTGYVDNGGSLFTVGDQGLPALGSGLECAQVGSRLAIVASGEESAAPGASATADSVVFVVDLVRAFKAHADGANQLPTVGMPSVVTAPDGTPGITVPNEDAPTDYRMSVLKLGDGKKIADDDAVVLKFTAVDWDSRAVTESTWKTGSASILDLAGTTASEGLKQAVSGEKVGSQILAVIPPDLAGTADVPAASTLVYVVDILGTVN